ncbi:hypothetical protein G7054_g9713 [Neopestalotiopsis clavispora]|nr:hypothetical protein G7054_g9713 [Neopestalotiopsis clavispora]
MASTTTYQYYPLEDEDTIRVLRLFPSGDPDAPIRVELLPCRLTETELESPAEAASPSEEPGVRERRDTQSRFRCNTDIQYDALSYTWGDLKDKDEQLVYIGEDASSSSPVTHNCLNALKALRQGESPRFLWIDALCINQADLKERTHQVRNMARIYASASSTIIYLGEHTYRSRAIFQWAAEELAHWEGYDHQEGVYSIHDEKKARNFLFDGSLEELVQRPWFHRVWVLQEVYLSKMLLVLCGEDITPIAILLDLWSPFPTLALLGSQQDELDRIIDYNKTFEEVSVELATELIDNHGISLLKMGRQGHSRDMPSWVPDLSQTSQVFLGEMDRDYGKISLKHSPASNQLRLRGWRIGQISELGDPFSFRNTIDLQQQMLAIACLAHFEWASHRANSNMVEFVRKYFPGRILEAFLTLGENSTRLLFNGLRFSTFRSVTDDAPYSDDVMDLLVRLDGQHIFLCTETDQVGMVPSIAAKGDILICVEGTYFPCLIRSVENGWRLISGECSAKYYQPRDEWRMTEHERQQEVYHGDFSGKIMWEGTLGEAEEFIIV